MSGTPRIYKHTIEALDIVNQEPFKSYTYGNNREHALYHYNVENGEGNVENIYEYIHYNKLICRVTIELLDGGFTRHSCYLGSGGYSQTDRENANSLLRALKVPRIKVHREAYTRSTVSGEVKDYRLCMRMDA